MIKTLKELIHDLCNCNGGAGCWEACEIAPEVLEAVKSSKYVDQSSDGRELCFSLTAAWYRKVGLRRCGRCGDAFLPEEMANDLRCLRCNVVFHKIKAGDVPEE